SFSLSPFLNFLVVSPYSTFNHLIWLSRYILSEDFSSQFTFYCLLHSVCQSKILAHKSVIGFDLHVCNNYYEVAHRQQFDFWKNFRNSRLKHILRRPLPEPATAPPTSAPPALLPTSVAPPAAPPPAPSPVTAAALSPMQYAIPPGFGLAKTGPRNASVDRRKRNRKDG
ncbi:mediator of RNA polymerase II transcription subunit 31-like, partial [Capsicum annuum]|uniref:mediator of RNA polymerase II transcription subunit 31-like n=1 Tax=Capsicum annuum TaxID=4072 RepID=UPI001FB07B60